MTDADDPGKGEAAPHILLVEDNIDQRELTMEALDDRMPRARITEAPDGPAALAALERDHIDMVVLDYSLPGMSGLEVLAAINDRGMRIPVIMVTGQGDETIAVEAMKNGAQDYIIKIKNYHEALPITIERALRQNRMKRDLEEASLRARRLYEISLAAAKERRVDAIAARLVAGAARLLGAEKGVFYLVAPGGTVSVLTSFGLDIDAETLKGAPEVMGLLAAPYTANRAMVLEDPAADPRWTTTPWLHGIARQLLAVPLTIQGRVEGALCVINKDNREAFSPEDVDTLATLAVHAGVAIDNARFVERIEQQAVSDSLTGLYNHMEFQKCLTKEVDRSRRYSGVFSLLLLDLDHFKMVNDTYGHQVGDAILKEIARILQFHLRTADKVFRYGGEEFAVLLPETDKEGARAISERICTTVASTSYTVAPSRDIKVTASIGLSTFPEDAILREEIIGSADQALYAAKRSGRNQVAAYNDALCAVADGGEPQLQDFLWHPYTGAMYDLIAGFHTRPPAVRPHSATARYAMRLADAVHLDEEDRRTLELAAWLEGTGVPARAAAPRRDGEATALPVPLLLKQARQVTAALQTVMYRGEHYDGHGGPEGLKADRIPYLARLLGVAAAYHGMTGERARPRLTHDEAVAGLRREAGRRFDPAVVEAFAGAVTPGETADSDPAAPQVPAH